MLERIVLASWPTLIFELVLASIAIYYLTQTPHGRTMLRRYAPWGDSTWRTMLVFGIIVLLLLIAPVANGMLILFSGIAYIIYRNQQLHGTRTFTSRLGLPERKKQGIAVEILCRDDAQPDFSEMKYALQRRLFACPYIKSGNPLTLRFDGEGYEISTQLTDEKYIPSILHYLQNAGYDVSLNR